MSGRIYPKACNPRLILDPELEALGFYAIAAKLIVYELKPRLKRLKIESLRTCLDTHNQAMDGRTNQRIQESRPTPEDPNNRHQLIASGLTAPWGRL